MKNRRNNGGALIRIGVIGYGYWGPNLVRNCFEAKDTQVACVSDLRDDRLALLASRYPTVKTTRDVCDLIDDPAIDAVAIATPVSTHYELALRSLQAGKHVLVEKPLASDTMQVQHLMDVAQKRNRVLMVDHTFVFTGSVRKIRELVDAGGLGEIYYYDSVRVNLGLFQHDVNVLWDLAVHDLAIMDYVLPFRPCAVSATGLSHVPGSTENIAYMTLFFEGSQIAHIHANWLAPVKLRRTLIGASRKMIVYDDLDQGEKVRVRSSTRCWWATGRETCSPLRLMGPKPSAGRSTIFCIASGRMKNPSPAEARDCVSLRFCRQLRNRWFSVEDRWNYGWVCFRRQHRFQRS
jgi:predicted dehydrogenase